jgi:hypothetical protein
MGDRIKNAIEFLKDGLPFKVGELYFGIDDSNYLNITGASKFIHLQNITKRTALRELNEIKSLFEEMVLSSVDLKDFIRDKQLKFNLDFDYGMGDIRICTEKSGILKWEAEISE